MKTIGSFPCEQIMDSEFVLKEREDPKIETYRHRWKWGEQLGGVGGEQSCARDFNERIL